MKNQFSSTVTSEEIAQRAHDIWEQSGCPDGQALEHWLRAERELQDERGQAEQLGGSARASRARNEVGRSSSTSGG